MMSNVAVTYGSGDVFVDVTNVFEGTDVVFIPPTAQQRAKLFRVDFEPGFAKYVIVTRPGFECITVPEHARLLLAKQDDHFVEINGAAGMAIVDAVLRHVHAATSLRSADWGCDAGGMEAELPEQRMIAGFLRPDATVLELGANVGRSTCVAASMLDDDRRLVTLECCAAYCKGLEHNRHANGLRFEVVGAALSKTPLEHCGWSCRPATAGGACGWERVSTVDSLAKLQERVGGAAFDTLIADCEGALAAVFREFPELLEGIHTVILENDFQRLPDKAYVDHVMTTAGLERVFSQPLSDTPNAVMPCWASFYEVWQLPSGDAIT